MYTLEEGTFGSALHRHKLAAFSLLIHQVVQKQSYSLEDIGQKSGFENDFCLARNKRIPILAGDY